ncbi:MAG: nuclear transport factor 2 family protein [Xanthomonadales bacterium]|nr:nuclear transport factor 2 family protein [Xanthomonadales bacterium]
MLSALVAACAGNSEKHQYVPAYEQAMASADFESAVDVGALPDGPRRFYEFLDNFSAETVSRETGAVYAEDAFLNDTLKTLRGRQAIEAYFTETFTHVESLEAEVVEVVGADRSWFFRWRMTLVFKDLNDGQPSTSVGVSHVIFDDAGQVQVHQDYWDAATHFFSMVPIAGKIIEKVKDRL